MSMSMQIVAIKQGVFNRIQEDEQALKKILIFDPKILKEFGIREMNCVDLDYRSIEEAVISLTELMGEDDEVSFDAEGVFNYDAGYGPAMWWSWTKFAKALKSGAGWNVAFEIEPKLRKLSKRIKEQKLWVIANIS
ncbi:hypothetical protein AB3N58_17670 (plasmid) [Leptospira sp. WS60.C2]